MTDLSQLENICIQFFSNMDKNWSLCYFPFLGLFIIFFAIYLCINKQHSTLTKIYVVTFGLFFAFKANGMLMLFLPLTTLLSWFLTKKMMLIPKKANRKWLLSVTLLIELLPLSYYKYAIFSINIITDLLKSNLTIEKVILPVGISFYTFQAISYTVDVYKKRFDAKTKLLDYVFYLTFFPLLIAGPIVRASVLLPQISSKTSPKKELVYKGLWLIMIGFIKKAIIADYLALFNNIVFEVPSLNTGFANMMGVIGYSLQIYFDFSGYSDLAIGFAAVMGYELNDNFWFPYKSTSLTDFWHRWHISLSTWFRDFLYIPLGGNRKGNIRTYLNIFVIMLIAGLWHGSSLMFLIWGLLHGIGLIFHKFCMKNGLNKIPNTTVVKGVCWLVTFAYVTFAWIFFRSPNLDTALELITNIIQTAHLSDAYDFLLRYPIWAIMLVVCLELLSIREADYKWIEEKFIRMPWILKVLVILVVIQIVINLSQDNIQPFIYKQF